MIHKKGNPVPRDWYEILEGEEENQGFTFEFLKDCTEIVSDGVRYLTAKSYPVMVVRDADNLRISFNPALEIRIHAVPEDPYPVIATSGAYPA